MTTTDFTSKNAKKAIFQAWLIVGTLDILAACTQYYINTGKGPTGVLVYVASGLLGMKAFEIGAPIAIVGLALHYVIAFIWTLFFFKIYPHVPFLSRNRIATGILYGAFVWTMMSQIVVRLSGTPKGPFNLTGAIIGAAILMVAIGIPLSYLAHKYYKGS